jgi:aminoethylphosphonate catabolism LysR family transcriptional regulator
MRYVQLRAFHHVALAGGFSRAAEVLGLSQPAISDQVRKLEEQYEVVLFNRQRRQVTPTVAGLKLLKITRRLFDAETEALDLLSENRALRVGTLRIIVDSVRHIRSALAEFRRRYPGVRVVLRVGHSEAVTDALHAYEADLGVLGEIPETRHFAILPLNSAPIVAFVAKNHPLADRGALTLAELGGEVLVMRERGSKTRAKLESAAEREGVPLLPTIEAEGREALRDVVAGGNGVGFVSAAEFEPDARLVAIPLKTTLPLTMDEALICLHERLDGKLVRAFFELARAQAKTDQPHGAVKDSHG